MTYEFWGGVIALIVTVAAVAYLRVRVRHLHYGVELARDFRADIRSLVEAKLPEGEREFLLHFNDVVGSGRIAQFLAAKLVRGELVSKDRAAFRNRIAVDRDHWRDFDPADRLRYVQAIFAGVLADSYFAGISGIVLRRSLFFVGAHPREIAKAMEAYETKVLIIGAERATEQFTQRDSEGRSNHGNGMATAGR